MDITAISVKIIININIFYVATSVQLPLLIMCVATSVKPYWNSQPSWALPYWNSQTVMIATLSTSTREMCKYCCTTRENQW